MKKKLGSSLLKVTQRLDVLTSSGGKLTEQATLIVENENRLATATLCRMLIDIVDNSHQDAQMSEIAKRVMTSLALFLGYQTICDICTTSSVNHSTIEDKVSLPDLIQELFNLVGLKKVKDKVCDLIAFQKVQQLRVNEGLIPSKSTLHLVFMGNPGTGKTTVARIIGRIYKGLNLLSKGHFVEVSRTDLIAGYQGQTALKVRDVIERAKGGVLFIDEAYSITENSVSDSYGKECLTELTKALEDYRNDLVVIVAGYTKPMEKFLAGNPGLRSRFNTIIEFDDYNVEELEGILVKICEDNDYFLTVEALNMIRTILITSVENKDGEFANGRFVRNLYDSLIMNQARRVDVIDTPTIDQLRAITVIDVQTLLKNII